jgi:hypothetical protein
LFAVAGPPVQRYVAPGVVELPFNVTLVVVHVICAGATTLTFGNVPLELIVTVEVAVHPFTGFVAVTVYVPAAETEAGLAALTNVPPFQTIVLPALVPVNVAVVVEQEMLLLLAEDTVGVVVFDDIVTVEVFVQPFKALVDVTVYVPAALTIAGFAVLLNDPPFHTIVLPTLVPVKVTVDVVQLILPELAALTLGGVVLLLIVTVDVAVHPFVALVEVTVYVPAAFTEAGFAAFTNMPPFQTIVLPADVPDNVAVDVVHVIVPDPADVTVGGVVFPVTETVDVDVQPLVEFVAVTVYVPAAFTVAGLAAFINVPPFHIIVLPAQVPVKIEVGVIQLILLLLADVTVGFVVSIVTATVAVFVQPVLVFVTVTV